jgi:hypothetical protein
VIVEAVAAVLVLGLAFFTTFAAVAGVVGVPRALEATDQTSAPRRWRALLLGRWPG